jgi:hypothetical protein
MFARAVATVRSGRPRVERGSLWYVTRATPVTGADSTTILTEKSTKFLHAFRSEPRHYKRRLLRPYGLCQLD